MLAALQYIVIIRNFLTIYIKELRCILQRAAYA